MQVCEVLHRHKAAREVFVIDHLLLDKRFHRLHYTEYSGGALVDQIRPPVLRRLSAASWPSPANVTPAVVSNNWTKLWLGLVAATAATD